MKSIKAVILITILATGFASCKQEIQAQEVKQSFTEHAPTAHHKIALEVLEASKTWIANFNSGNTEACVKGYDEKATMKVMPFGVKKGITEISEFWIPFAKSGATNLIYTNVSVEIVDEKTAFLAANWSMNVGNGIIFQEKWEKKSGKWILTYDDFKVLEQFKSPKENTTNPIASHLILEDVIKASIEWTKGFNTQKEAVCGNGYAKDAYLNAVPFAAINGKKGIQGFWGKLIKDGAKNLTYHNPTFKVTTNNTAFLSSQWSMNIGEGKIYQEKWEKINNTLVINLR